MTLNKSAGKGAQETDTKHLFAYTKGNHVWHRKSTPPLPDIFSFILVTWFF